MANVNRSVLDWPTGVTVYKPEKCYGGYTTVTPYHSELILLIDMLGRVVHAWRSDPDEFARAWCLRLLPNDNWLTMNHILAPEARKATAPNVLKGPATRTAVVELDWEGNVIWRHELPLDRPMHHDAARLENGNTLILVDRKVTHDVISDKPFADDEYIEVDPSGHVVWEWSTVAHFEQFGYSEQSRRLMYERGGDIFHTNTCAVLPPNALEATDARFRRGNILSSQRNTNVVYIIDRESGDVVWTWGDQSGGLVGQHHPGMLANGNILIYDNGGQGGYPPRCRFYTRLVEVDPLSGEIAWQYAHEPYTLKPMSRFFSSSWGSVQRLPNGNTFSLDCHKGRLFEVTPWGEIVWEYVSPFSWGRGTNVIEPGMYRAYRYGYDQVPQVDRWFPNTDGHVGVRPVEVPLPEGLGLPADAPGRKGVRL
jgi:hypothetical protein